MKNVVDKFECGKEIPRCQLKARLVDPSKHQPLQFTVNLKGAKDPYNVFNILMDGE